uniref:Uncharacterized protein n=1 Tax=Amphiprion percula TaxID=161767 RepID=A0A3P8T3I1_AMPPE
MLSLGSEEQNEVTDTDAQNENWYSLGDRMRSLDIWSRTTNPSLQKCRGGSTSGCLSLEGLNLHTGVPIVYELDRNLKPLGPMQFPGGKVKK